MSQRSSSISVTSRVLDAIGLIALLLAFTVSLTGGFREWTPLGRLSVTSWLRPLVIALVAIGVRHWLQPRPTIFQRAMEAVSAARNTPGVREALPIVVSTRAIVLLVGFLAVAMLGYRPDIPVPWRMYENEFLNLPARWDTGWYLGIASEGYTYDASQVTRQQNIAFFPLYPMLMRYGSLFLARDLLWTGVAISWLSFFGALVYLHRFARERFGDDVGRVSVALLACYPFALYFSTTYTEALFLLTIVAACYHFERNELWQAGVWGLLAGLSRPNGCLLSVVLALIAVRPLWPFQWNALGARQWLGIADRIAVAALPGIGMLIYSTYIFFLTGHPFQWAAQNAAWGRVYRGLDTLVMNQAQLISDEGVYTFTATRTVDALHLAAVVFVLGTIWPVFRRVGFPYAVMIAVNVIPPLLIGGLLSMGRVTSVLFPAFLWLALVIPTHHRAAWLSAFAMLQAIAAAVFFTWRPLF